MSHNSEINEYFLSSPEAEHLQWKRGEYLCRESGRLERLHLLLSGRFRVFRSLSNGREILYRIYLPGSVIGDVEVFAGSEAASCSVQCIETAETIALPMSSISNFPERYPRLIFSLGRGIARKLHENSISEALNTGYSLEVKLAHYYLSFNDPALQAQTLGQLADWMGCSYRHLTRNLASLRKKGAIQKLEKTDTAGYIAADRVVLKEIAEPLLQEGNSKRLFEPGDE